MIDGKVVLNKRYVLNKGVLVEAQTGLVKDAIDSLHVNGKYLVFITNGKVSGVQNAFGADFMYHVLDDITFVQLDDEAISKMHLLKNVKTICILMRKWMKVFVAGYIHILIKHRELMQFVLSFMIFMYLFQPLF